MSGNSRKKWPLSPYSSLISMKHRLEEVSTTWPSRRWAPPCGRSTGCSPKGRSRVSPMRSSSSGFSPSADAAAFEVLVARHGPMVLSVCRGVLRDPNDAEDAFQATFLVLVKKGGSIRGRDALGGWLHQVAHRVALRANAAAGAAVDARKAGGTDGCRDCQRPARRPRDELLRALHEEIARLPEKFRLAIVLCDLQGVPQDRGRRGVAIERADAAAPAERGACAAQGPTGPPRAGTRRRDAGGNSSARGQARRAGGLARDDRPGSAGHCEADRRRRGRLGGGRETWLRRCSRSCCSKSSSWPRSYSLGAGLIGWGAAAALISRGDEPRRSADAVAAGATNRPANGRDRRSAAETDSADTAGTFPVRGQVLDPDGKPVANAGVYVRPYAEVPLDSHFDPVPRGQKGRVAASDANGRFHFELDKACERCRPMAIMTTLAQGPDRGRGAGICAGLGRGRHTGKRRRGDAAAGARRCAGSRPRARYARPAGRRRQSSGSGGSGVVKDGVDLDAMLAGADVDDAQISASYGYDELLWPGGQNTWTSDTDGRFEVKGIGRRPAWNALFPRSRAGEREGLCHGSAGQNTFKTPMATRPGFDCQGGERSEVAGRSDVRARGCPHQADPWSGPVQGNEQAGG